MPPYIPALLVIFGVLSLLHKRSRSEAGFLPLLAALAPVLAKGAMSLIGGKQKKAAAQQAEEQRKLEAQQADTLARQQWDTQQNSPASQAGRFKNTMQLGRLAGAMGGLDKLPPSIAKYYQSQRTMPTYGGTSSYVAPAKKGGGVWDFLGEAAKAVSYLDPAAFKSGGASAGLKAAGGAAAQSGGLGALQGGGMATSIADLTQRLKG